MTIQKNNIQNKNNIAIGNIIKKHRKEKTFADNSSNTSREKFINDALPLELLPSEWISVKTLMNIELGKNIPSVKTLKKLAKAFDIDLSTLIKEIEPYINITD